ncbi:hypothetical protein GCM10010149_68690 [Nonomuraea roseoviolacea subsp. roseoviolacea]|uniref:tyrosine-type recombinase/integrase n=1 Tax=Nonomuraea roseoviolacea TaxID=103837 RepID=UPI003376B705
MRARRHGQPVRLNPRHRVFRVGHVTWQESDLLIATKYGTPIEPRNFNRASDAHAHCKHAGIPYIRIHDTRHTCASFLAALDVHPRVAMRILRDSQISVTINVYNRIASPETRKTLARLNAILGNGPPSS